MVFESTPDFIAVLLLLVALCFFMFLGIKDNRKGQKDFLFAGRKLRGKDFQHTFIAGATSLAAVLAFLLTAGAIYGVVLFVILFAAIAGHYIFFKIALKSKIDLKNFNTMSEFVKEKSGSTSAYFIIKTITLFSFIGILLVEILIGTKIFANLIDVENAEFIGFLGITIFTFIYTGIGGFSTVVKSDRWQFKLVIGSLIALFLFVVFAFPFESTSLNPVNFFMWTATPAMLVTLIINALVVNLVLPICKLSSWHRIAGVGKWDTVNKNFKQGLWKMILLWGGFILFTLILKGAGITFQSLPELFNFVKMQGSFFSHVLYPLIFLGLAAALISTADSTLLAILLETKNKNFFKKKGRTFVLTDFVVFALLFLLLLAGFFLLNSNFGIYFIHLLFILFGQLIVMFPLIMLFLNPKRIPSRKEINIASFGALVGLILIWVLSVYGIITNNLVWTQISPPIGLALIFVLQFITKKIN